MARFNDGPESPLFSPIPFAGNCALAALAGKGLSEKLTKALGDMPAGLRRSIRASSRWKEENTQSCCAAANRAPSWTR